MTHDDPTLPTKTDIEGAEVEGLERGLAWTRRQPPTQALGALAKLGDQEPLYAAGAALAIVGLVARDRKLLLAGARVIASVAVADAMKSVVKKLVKRSRPHKVSEGEPYRSEAGGSSDKGEQSFPSGHVAATLAASRALARVYPRSGAPGAFVTVALGATRVAQAEHWPTDVAAGAGIGLLAEAATHVAFQAADRWTRPRGFSLGSAREQTRAEMRLRPKQDRTRHGALEAEL